MGAVGPAPPRPPAGGDLSSGLPVARSAARARAQAFASRLGLRVGEVMSFTGNYSGERQRLKRATRADQSAGPG